MCPHVLCLSLLAPPPTLLSPHKLAFFTFLIPLKRILSLSLPWLLLHLFVGSPENHQFLLNILSLDFCCYHPLRTMKARCRRCRSSSLKQEFLKKWMKGLQICRSKEYATILERRNAIKLSADVAIASTRNAASHWSRALLGDVVSRDVTNKTLVQHILGDGLESRASARSIACSRRILRRSRIARQRATRVVPRRLMSTAAIAKKLVKNRTRALRKLVPGGEEMDGVSLLQETLDYIVSLRAQVNVMRQVAAAAAAAR